jgi:osmotically-inducible protein OsmY
MLKIQKYNKIILLLILGPVLLAGCKDKQKTNEIIQAENPDWVITDSIIRYAVSEELMQHPEVQSDQIDLDVFNGIVRLSGSTENILSSERAGEITSAISGVRGVINRIEIRHASKSDEEISRILNAALYQDPVSDSYEYELEVDDGRVTLRGVVDSWPEREQAGNIAKSIGGVQQVNNNVVFRFDDRQRSDLDILADIHMIHYDDLYLNNEMIDVEVRNGRVELSGEAGSIIERIRFITKSYVPGVDTVIADGLNVAEDIDNPRMRAMKDVNRSDQEIREALFSALIIDPEVTDFSDISLSVESGTVNLGGQVPDQRTRQAAGEDAENILGVRTVNNNIWVGTGEIPSRHPLEFNLETAMDLHPSLVEYKLEAEVLKGRVNIEGSVNNTHDKQLIDKILSKVPGIPEIHNNVTIRS